MWPFHWVYQIPHFNIQNLHLAKGLEHWCWNRNNVWCSFCQCKCNSAFQKKKGLSAATLSLLKTCQQEVSACSLGIIPLLKYQEKAILEKKLKVHLMNHIIRPQGHQRNIFTRTTDLVSTCQTCHCWTSVIFSFRTVLTKIRGDHVVNDTCAVSAEKHHAGIEWQWVTARSTRCSREKHHLNAWSLNGNVSFLCFSTCVRPQ